HPMALREDEPVTILPVGPVRVVTEKTAEVQRDDELHGRQRSAGVTALRLGEHLEDVAPYGDGASLECRNVARARAPRLSLVLLHAHSLAGARSPARLRRQHRNVAGCREARETG